MANLLAGLNLNDANVRNGLPEWLRRQIIPVSNDENGPQFGFNGLYDQQGNQVYQVGENHDPNDTSTGDLSLYDPRNYHADPSLGNVTDIRNIRNVTAASFTNGLRLTQLAMAAMAGAGLMGAGGAGAAGAEGAGMVDTLGAGTAADGFAGSNLGAWGAGGAGEMGAGLLGDGVTADTFANVAGGGSTTAGTTSPGLLGGLGDSLNNGASGLMESITSNPLQSLMRGMSLYNMGRGLLNRGDNTNAGDNNGEDKGGNGTAVNTPPLQRGPWTPNPITAAQIQNFQYARPRG